MNFREILEHLKRPIGRTDAGLWGDFGMQVFDHRTGVPKRILRIRKKNQITNGGREALLNLLGIGNGASYLTVQEENKLWSLSVGTNTTPPTVTDTTAVMSVVWADRFIFPAECQIVATPPNSYYLAISKALGTTEANGSTLTEAGIFTRGDNDDATLSTNKTLYARQIHSPILKTSTMTIQYDWQLGITIA